MSIEVNHITKLYGAQKALNDVSFSVGEKEIVGFLGPNGAGKSTMMKIITCYIPPTNGTVKVCGFDTAEESIAVRRQIGYLPEHNPLYLDMYVKEFLAFAAGLYNVKNTVQRVKDMIALTGLEREQNKKIGALSKGYRQRVGLAQAMIHDPKVLIMDEPTTGLDPNQLQEIRNLIKQLGNEKTVMLSTHIMQEVEALCNRVIIINKGEIVANADTRDLQANNKRQMITVEFDKPTSASQLRKIAHVTDARNKRDNIWQLSISTQDDVRKTIFDFAVQNQLSVLTLTRDEQKLEDIFKQLTAESQS